MPRINVKLDEVESGFADVPDAEYLVEVQSSSKVGTSKASGAGCIYWYGKIMEGEYEGKLLSWTTSLQPQALFNLKQFLEAVANEGEKIWGDDGFDVEDIFGRQLVVRTSHRTDDDGNSRVQVSEYIHA